MFKGILNFIFSPFTTAIYNVFVLGPLHFLNLLNKCFDFVTGSSVTDLLFKTTFVDGKPQLNFFQSNSPLKPMFMIMVAIGALLIISFSSISIASNLIKFEKKQWITKIRNVLSSTTGIFLIPLCFLTILSLSGTLVNVINGKRIAMSNNDQIIYSTETKKRLQKIKEVKQNLLANLNEEQIIFNVFLEEEKENERKYLTINQIYENFFSEKWDFKEGDPILLKISANKNSFLKIKNLLKSKEFNINADNVLTIINNLQPNLKNENFANEIKASSQYFYNINENIDNFIKTGNEINKNFVDLPRNFQDKAFFNYKQLFDYVLGKNNKVIYVKNTNTSNFLDFKEETNTLINGSIDKPTSGLFYLRQQLSNVEENSLVVKFYQLTTNKADSNWENPKWIWGLPPNLFVGSIIIYIAIFLMCLNIIFAFIRILNLAMLFVISPTVAMASSIDGGTTFKGWIKVVLSNLFSIFGMIIILKLFGTIFTTFDEMTKHLSIEQDGISSKTRNILLSLFGIGGLLASRKAVKQIDKIFNSQKSFLGSFEGSNVLRIFKNASNTLWRRENILSNSYNDPFPKHDAFKTQMLNLNHKFNRSNLLRNNNEKPNSTNEIKNWNDWKMFLSQKQKTSNEK